MRHSQEEKAKTHQRIVKTASRLFREKGFDGIGLADLMKEAGVTVGGFYKHFKSKDALIQEAMADATQPPPCTQSSIDQHTEFVDLLKFYLGLDHKDAPGKGCSFAALSSEMRRCDPETRALLTKRLAGTMETLTEWLGGGKEARRKAIFAYSSMLGAVSFARMVDDEKFSAEIIESVQQSLEKFDTKSTKQKR